MSEEVKGIILAGGEGTRLRPMTSLISKQLLPIYNKPMILFPLKVLIDAGIKEILIITKPNEQDNFKKLIGDGSKWNIEIDYLTQKKSLGIAEALIIAKEWLDNSRSLLILGDNLFFGKNLSRILRDTFQKTVGARIFGFKVPHPERFGVVVFDENNEIKHIEEKPEIPKSNWVVTGLYYYDEKAPELAENLTPSERGELEITDLNNEYLRINQLDIELLDKKFTWLDTGTPDALLEASNYVKSIEDQK